MIITILVLSLISMSALFLLGVILCHWEDTYNHRYPNQVFRIIRAAIIVFGAICSISTITWGVMFLTKVAL